MNRKSNHKNPGKGASERKRGVISGLRDHPVTDEALRDRLDFETLISEFSASLINLPDEDLEDEVVSWLGKFSRPLGVDRASVMEFLNEENRFRVVRIYTSPGIKPFPAGYQPEPIPYVDEAILRNEIVKWERIPDDLPEELKAVDFRIVKDGTKSYLAIPLKARQSIIGACIFGAIHQERRWSDDIVRRLRLMGEIIANALMRKRAGESLKKEIIQRRFFEERNATILKSAMIGFWILDREGNIKEVNDNYCRMVGYSREELLSMNLYDLDPDRSKEEIAKILTNSRDMEPVRFEIRHRRKDGEWVDLEVNRSYLPIEDGFFSFFRDITELKRTQRNLEKRLIFEELLSGLSTELINLPYKNFGPPLRVWLKRIVEFLEVDHVALSEFSEDKSHFMMILPYTVPGVQEPPLEQRPKPPSPVVKKLKEGKVIKFNRIPEDIPDELDPSELRSVQDGTKSFLAIPLMAKGSSIGCIIFGNFREYKIWTDEVIQQLRILGEMIANFLLRRKTEKELEERLNFETIVSEFSASLINLPPEDLGGALEAWLKRFVEFLGVDRAGISQFAEDKSRIVFLKSYFKSQDPMQQVSSYPRTDFWWIKQLLAGKEVNLSRIPNELPKEVTPEEREKFKNGTKSFLAVPLDVRGSVLGYLAFGTINDYRTWPEVLVRRIRLVAEIIANTLVRNKVERDIVEYRDHLEKLVEERTRKLQAAQEELVQKERLATLGKLTAMVSHELRNPLGTIRTSLFSIGQRLHDYEPRVEKALERAERGIIRCDRIIEELLDFTRVRPLDLEMTGIDEWLAEILEEWEIPEGILLEKRFEAGVEVKLDRERFRRCMINILNNAVQAIEQKGSGKGKRLLKVLTKGDGDYLRILIEDSGVGIDSESLEKIFEPLYSTKSFGVGLGIPIARQIVEQHGGRMRIKSGKRNEGTRVSLEIPLREKARKPRVGTPRALRGDE